MICAASRANVIKARSGNQHVGRDIMCYCLLLPDLFKNERPIGRQEDSANIGVEHSPAVQLPARLFDVAGCTDIHADISPLL